MQSVGNGDWDAREGAMQSTVLRKWRLGCAGDMWSSGRGRREIYGRHLVMRLSFVASLVFRESSERASCAGAAPATHNAW